MIDIINPKVKPQKMLAVDKIKVFKSDIFEVVDKISFDSPCYMCAKMRRGYLYNKAKELGCNKIALGHHFNDVIETTLLSMFYGSEVKTMMPKLHSDNFEGLELIRPLYLVEEDSIISWKNYNKLTFINCACRFTESVTLTNNSNSVSKRKEIKELIKELKKINNVRRYLVNDAIINKIATTKNPQNILGIVKMLDHNITNLLPIIKGNKTKLIMLDDVNDPGNLGTIIRTAAGLGYDGIIMSPNTVDLYNEKVIRSTQGVMFKIPIIKANLQEVIKMLKKEKVFCIGTALTNAKDVKHITKKDKFAICLGNEAKGISKEVLDNMDENVKIAMNNDVESLNVSIAAGIIMYEMME